MKCNFYCINDECETGSVSVSMDDCYKEDVEVICGECDKPLKLLGHDPSFVISLTMDEKVAYLKQRSKDHYQREVRGEKEKMERKIKGLE